MRRQTLAIVLAALSGCAQTNVGTPPPTDSFYYPVSLAAVEMTPGEPILYVVSSNFDLAFNHGTILAVDTAKLSDPPNGSVAKAVDQKAGWVTIDHFGGEIASYFPKRPTQNEKLRLFVPTRYDNRLSVVRADGDGTTLSCLPDFDAGQDCQPQGILLQDSDDSVIRAVDPFGVVIDGQTALVTHLHQADDPPETGQNPTAYVVQLNAETLTSLNFIEIGPAPAEGAAATPAGVYIGGRSLASSTIGSSQALRNIVEGTVVDVGLTASTAIQEVRSVALASDKSRIYATTRSPDGLVVVDISQDLLGGFPRNRVLGFTTLPSGPSELIVLPRPGQRDLVAVSCTDANAVTFFDDETGEATGLVSGIVEPFGLAHSSIAGNPSGARVFVASFGNHTVDVIDIADLSRPRTALLVGHLGLGAHRPLGVPLPGSLP
jgi:DNA-binding beta-propeller fold protein YncE